MPQAEQKLNELVDVTSDHFAVIESIARQCVTHESIVLNVRNIETGEVTRAIVTGVGTDYMSEFECITAELDPDNQ